MEKKTIFLAGDSTVQTYEAKEAPQAGWGQFLHLFVSQYQIKNEAIGGRSSKTFVEEGRLDQILTQLSKQDILLIQMGHNDSTISRPERFTEPFTTYKDYLKMYVQGAKEKGADAILITPVARLHVEEDCFINDFLEYCQAMKQVASEEQVPCIDLMEKSLQYYQSVGYEETKTFFMVSVNGTDHTHFTEKGASKIAELVAEDLLTIIGVRKESITLGEL